VIYTHAGPEIGVASTKAFTSQLCALYMLAVYLGRRRGTVDVASGQRLVAELQDMPDLVGRTLARDAGYAELASLYYHRSDFLYLGRGIQYPIALEGALKLKEISYIHAEGYPAGEMKHGPIALIDERMPVVALAPRDHVYAKMISQVEQVKARGGVVIAVATDGDQALIGKADHILHVPAAAPLLEPLLTAIPMQLLAYHLAVRRGCDVDQPRNLAKSVTVE
jgi:glucosamine--fructose-6-phosphate aminotransferase (isomerizing)